jgi:phosphohistidine phosphatase
MLLRHAKSSWQDPGMADRDRPLAPRGRRAASLMAEAMAARGLSADRILCSPARRTRETLAALLPNLADETRIAITAELYEPPSGDYRAVIARRGTDAGTLLLIGHNPAIQVTAFALSAPGPLRAALAEKLPTGSLVVIDFPDGDWTTLKPESGVITLFLRPADLDPREDGD